MSAIKAIWKNGRIVPSEPVDWPEGCELRVEPEFEATPIDSEVHGDDAPSIARWIKVFDAIPPVEMSAAEEADWLAARAEQAQLDINSFDDHATSLRDLTK